MFKKNTVSSAIAAVFASSISMHALSAESTDLAESEVDESEETTVIVTGIRGSIGRARDTKRDASGVVDSISTEDIGKFPDQNLAESLQRITGVSIDRSGGEGQFITVRGFGPQFNTVLVNGRQIASEDTSRAFSFDTMAAEMVSGIYVHKTSTAATQSGGIGATVNVTTARPFDIQGFKAVGSAKANYNDNSDKTTPEFFGLVSNTFDNDKFGVLFSVSRKEIKTRLNQAQTDGWLENVGIPQSELNGGAGRDGNVFSPRNFDLKVTFEERTRTNANLVFQYAPQDNLVLTADAAYSDFDIKSDATSYGHWFTAPNVENAVTDDNGTVIDMFQETGLATDFHAKKFDRLTETESFGLNAEWDVNESLIMGFDFGHSKATRAPNNGGGDQLSLIGYQNRVRFQSDDAVLPWASEFQAAAPGIVDGDGITRPVGDYLDPANGRAHVMLRRGWAVQDDIDQFRVDGVWDEAGQVKAKFGAMYSTETKALQRWDNEGAGIHCTFCGYPNSPDIPDGVLSVFNAGDNFLSGVSGSGRTPAVWLRHDGEAQFAFLEGISGANFDAVLRDNSFEVEENTLALYVEFDFETEIAAMPLNISTGVRYEDTDVTVDGTQASIESLRILDQTEMLATFGDAAAISAKSGYNFLLPNLNASLELNEDVIIRFSASRTLTRPTLSDMAPVTNIGTTRQGGDLTASSGNPELTPFTSDNIDLSLEWYYKEDSYVSLGYFTKNVNDFIVSGKVDRSFVVSNGSFLTDPSTGDNPGGTTLPDGSIDQGIDANDEEAVFTTTVPNNGENAIVSGLEFALQHTFGNSGFGTLFNFTLVDSNSDLDVADITQKFAVTGLSDSLNLVGFYEDGPYQLRVAYNYRQKFLQSLTQLNGDGVTFVDDYSQVDLSGSYDFNESVTVFFEVTNLTEEVVTKYGRYRNQFLNAEDAGRRFALGVKATF